MRIYVIGPVRIATEGQASIQANYCAKMEAEGHEVFLPQRDAPQDSPTGYEIVEAELEAIKEADEVHVFWDINSKGSHFDLGMAYALRKKIIMRYLFQPDSEDKSYVKVVAGMGAAKPCMGSWGDV